MGKQNCFVVVKGEKVDICSNVGITDGKDL
jgi:hypothetical protein